MNRAWQLQEAKNKFSNLVECAQNDGPQIVTKHGKAAVVIISADDYRKLARPKTNLHQFLRKSPMSDLDLDLYRDKKKPRDISLS